MNMRKDRRMQMIRTKYIHKQIVMLEKKKKRNRSSFQFHFHNFHKNNIYTFA